MNIQAVSTSLAGSVSSFGSAHLSTAASQEAVKAESGDTVTISAKGLSMFEENQTVAKEALAAVNDVASKDDNATLKTVLEGTSTDEDEDDDTTSTTTSLAGLTDAQIEQKVADGSITQAEANAELSARKSKADSEKQPATSIDVLV